MREEDRVFEVLGAIRFPFLLDENESFEGSSQDAEVSSP